MTYSGPTYIAIRSGKYDYSTAASHSADFKRLLEIRKFDSMMKFQNHIKAIVIIFSDGGSDENPRYPKVIAFAIRYFRDYTVDIIFVGTKAPGCSAFNRVETRMAPLTSQLSGVMLRHDDYGTPLDT